MPDQTLLLIYPDFLGDFLLFSPYLVEYRHMFEARFTRVVWLCHPSIMPLVQDNLPFFPANLEVVPADFSLTGLSIKKLVKWPIAMKSARQFLARYSLPGRYSQVWCPSFMPWLANSVLACVNSPRKLSRPVQNITYNCLQQVLNTQLFKLKHFDVFVYYQHHAFFEQAFQQSLPLPALKYYAEHGLPMVPKVCHSPYMVLVPDSAAESKEWPPDKFSALAQLILTHTHLHVIIIGVRDSVKQSLSTYLPESPRIVNLMQQTTVIELLSIIGQAKAVVCNDSFALHASTVMNTPVVCLTNGGYQGRYWPYPKELYAGPQQFLKSPTQSLKDLPIEQVWQSVQAFLPYELRVKAS